MFALAFEGLPSPVILEEESGAASKKQTKNKGGKGGGEVAKLFMRDESLLAGQAIKKNINTANWLLKTCNKRQHMIED